MRAPSKVGTRGISIEKVGHTTMASANKEEIRSTLRSAGLLKIDEDVLSKCMCVVHAFSFTTAYKCRITLLIVDCG